MVDLLNVISALQARKGEWKQIAADAEVPYSTLSKLARGKIANPGIGTINKLLPFLGREAARARRATA